jgi:DNA polymerase/3'-5' exonuclease PolX
MNTHKDVNSEDVSKVILLEIMPSCHRAEVAGEIRRGSEVDVVIIPKSYELGLFATGIASVVDRWKKIRGTLPCNNFSRIHPTLGIMVNFHVAEPATWGLILALKTGPQPFVEKVIFERMKAIGMTINDGWLCRVKGNDPIAVPEEQDLFNILKIEYVKPQDRR